MGPGAVRDGAVEGAEGDGLDVLLVGTNRYDLSEGRLGLRNKPLSEMSGPSVARGRLAAGWPACRMPKGRIWQRRPKR